MPEAMKTPLIAISVLLLAGCESSWTPTPITAEQAATLSVQLANDKAELVYHRRPFENKEPATFEGGRWVWKASKGTGILDFWALVGLAADGSTNSVDVKLLDDALRPKLIVPVDPLRPPAQ